ncbi:MAG: CvpA family protein [Fusobacteriaceae bacterium]
MYLDIFVLILLLLFMRKGFVIGFFVEFISIFGLIGNFFLARFFLPIILNIFNWDKFVMSKVYLYYIILGILYLCLIAITSAIGTFFAKQEKPLPIKIMGLVLGIIKGIIFCFILISIFQIISYNKPKLKKYSSESVSVEVFHKVIPYAYSYLPNEVRIKIDEILKNSLVEKYIKKI